MSDLYERKKIEGRGIPLEGRVYGCFALKDIKKGTIILSESPECVAEGGENYPECRTDPDEFQKFAMNVLSAFNKMSQTDKKEFLKLRNKYVVKKTYQLDPLINCLEERQTKGQLISKCPFGVIIWTKLPTKISALKSKKVVKLTK